MFLSQNNNHDEPLEVLWCKGESVGMGVKYTLVSTHHAGYIEHPVLIGLDLSLVFAAT